MPTARQLRADADEPLSVEALELCFTDARCAHLTRARLEQRVDEFAPESVSGAVCLKPRLQNAHGASARARRDPDVVVRVGRERRDTGFRNALLVSVLME